MTTRSKVLAAGALHGQPAGPVFTCPAITTVLFKSFILYASNGTADKVSITLARPSAGSFAPLGTFDLVGYGSVFQEIWTVLEPGDTISLTFGQPRLDYWFSGAELPTVST